MNDVLSATLGVSGGENIGVFSEASVFWDWGTFQFGFERDWAIQSTLSEQSLKKKQQLFSFILFKYSSGQCPATVPSLAFVTLVLFFSFGRYDHTRLPAPGGAAAPAPPPRSSAALHNPRHPPEHSAPIIRSKLHETGKREKKTLVLRDRSEWEWCCAPPPWCLMGVR